MSGQIIHKTTRADVEANELQIIFKALLEHFQGDHSVIAAEQVYRLFGVPHRKLIEQGWLKGCDCGDCAGGLVPAGDLQRALDGIEVPVPPAGRGAGPAPAVPLRGEAGIEVLGTMTASIRQLREEIEMHWQALAARMQMENWDQHDKDAFADATRSLYRESQALDGLLFEKTFSTRWL